MTPVGGVEDPPLSVEGRHTAMSVFASLSKSTRTAGVAASTGVARKANARMANHNTDKLNPFLSRTGNLSFITVSPSASMTGALIELFQDQVVFFTGLTPLTLHATSPAVIRRRSFPAGDLMLMLLRRHRYPVLSETRIAVCPIPWPVFVLWFRASAGNCSRGEQSGALPSARGAEGREFLGRYPRSVRMMINHKRQGRAGMEAAASGSEPGPRKSHPMGGRDPDEKGEERP